MSVHAAAFQAVTKHASELIEENDAVESGLSRVNAGFMKTYTYSRARQRFAEVLEEASREGEVRIRRQDGRVYAVTPIAKPAESPFAIVRAGPSEGRRQGTCYEQLARLDGHAADAPCVALPYVASHVAKTAEVERDGKLLMTMVARAYCLRQNTHSESEGYGGALW